MQDPYIASIIGKAETQADLSAACHPDATIVILNDEGSYQRVDASTISATYVSLANTKKTLERVIDERHKAQCKIDHVIDLLRDLADDADDQGESLSEDLLAIADAVGMTLTKTVRATVTFQVAVEVEMPMGADVADYDFEISDIDLRGNADEAEISSWNTVDVDVDTRS